MATKIEIYRKQKGYTMKDLAEIIGVSAMAVSYWESLKLVPSSRNLLKLCRALDTTVSDLWQPEWDTMPSRSHKRKECS